MTYTVDQEKNVLSSFEKEESHNTIPLTQIPENSRSLDSFKSFIQEEYKKHNFYKNPDELYLEKQIASSKEVFRKLQEQYQAKIKDQMKDRSVSLEDIEKDMSMVTDEIDGLIEKYLAMKDEEKMNKKIDESLEKEENPVFMEKITTDLFRIGNGFYITGSSHLYQDQEQIESNNVNIDDDHDHVINTMIDEEDIEVDSIGKIDYMPQPEYSNSSQTEREQKRNYIFTAIYEFNRVALYIIRQYELQQEVEQLSHTEEFLPPQLKEYRLPKHLLGATNKKMAQFCKEYIAEDTLANIHDATDNEDLTNYLIHIDLDKHSTEEIKYNLFNKMQQLERKTKSRS